MKNLFSIGLLSIMFMGCATWDGLKYDSSNAWKKTKETSSKIYDATKKKIKEISED